MLSALVCLLAVASASAVHRSLREEPVETGLCDATVKSYSGYYTVASGKDKNYFYWFFESREAQTEDTPVIVWLTGGPGCSSQLALLAENGPCSVSADGQSTINNPFSWNTKANIMWVDQPANVGYSYGGGPIDYDHNESQVGEDMYWFLQEWFKGHDEFLERPLYIFGESYGGHYAPAVAHRVFTGNNHKDGPLHLNLAGVAVGNGLTDPVVQYQYYPEMAMNNSYGIKTVTEDQYAKMVKHLPTCIKLAEMCQVNNTYCEAADEFCQMTETMPYYSSGLNPYDVRKPCGDSDLCYDFDNVGVFMNLPSTREALHVSDKVDKWLDCNTVVNAGFISDWMRDYQQLLIPMLEHNINVLVYAGDADFICNWIGNKAWTMELNWSGKEAFNAAYDVNWDYKEKATNSMVRGGQIRSAKAAKGTGSLSFLLVYRAGHMVPMDQPEAALALANTFVYGMDWVH